MKFVLLPVMLMVAALAGCGGGDDAAPAPAAGPAVGAPPAGVDVAIPPPPAPTAPATPTGLAVVPGAKRLDFTWNAAADATTYRLLEDLDGPGPGAPVQVGPAVAANAASYTPQALLHSRLNAHYLVQACNVVGCSPASLAVTPGLNAAIGYFKASNTGFGDGFGWAVALSADGATLAVGARGEDSNATAADGNQADNSINGAGAVYVFVRSAGGAWAQQAYLKPSHPALMGEFGFALAFSSDGTVLAVGATGEDGGAGAVYLFRRSASGSWTREARVTTANAEAGDMFGFSVSLSGDGSVLAASAYGESSGSTGVGNDAADNSAPDSGAVYVFRRGAGGWLQEAYVKASDTSSQARFGSALALSIDGSTLAVGAKEAVGRTGAAYVFTAPGGAWVQQARLAASNAEAEDQFGAAVALSADGSTLAVGAAFEDGGATGVDGNQGDNSAASSGAAYVFTRTGTAWSQQAYLKAFNTRAGDIFGMAVALSADGSTLAVGAPYEDGDGAGLDPAPAGHGTTHAGGAHVFRRLGSAWSHVAYLKPPNPMAWADFGHALSLSSDGASLAIGAWGEESAASGIQGNQADRSMPMSGAVYLY